MGTRNARADLRRHLGGVFTPTEAAGVAVVYSLFVTMFIYREVDLPETGRILMSAAFLIAQILLIVTSAGVYSWLLTTSGIPQQIVSSINARGLPRWELLLMLNAILLLAGSFLEPPAAILILTPLLLPVVREVGVNPVHFGIIVAVNLSLGMYMPPFGLNLFSSQTVFETPLGRIYLGVLPFLAGQFRGSDAHYLRARDLDGAGRGVLAGRTSFLHSASRGPPALALPLSGGENRKPQAQKLLSRHEPQRRRKRCRNVARTPRDRAPAFGIIRVPSCSGCGGIQISVVQNSAA